MLANTGDAFVPQHWTTVTPASGWTILPGRFTDDQLTDIVGYHSGDGELWVGKFRYVGVEGYCWPLSAAPGEPIDFHLSSEGLVDVTYLRHDADAADVRSVEVHSEQTTPGVQPTPATAWRDGCGWTLVARNGRSLPTGSPGCTRRGARTSTATRPTSRSS